MLSVNEKFIKVLEQVNKVYKKEWGYDLTANELIRLWRAGDIQLTDSQEDALIEYTEGTIK